MSEPTPSTPTSPGEETALYVTLAVVGTALIAAAIASRGSADTGATFGMACVALALAGWISQLRTTLHARRRR